MKNRSGQQRQSKLSRRLTQTVQTLQAIANPQAAPLKSGARVPELWVRDAGATEPTVYPLLGERYLLGRSSKSCDMVVRNPVVSQVHLSLTQGRKRSSSFVIRDENSTNGIYVGKRRVSSLTLRHGDRLTLGPPELATAVRIQYHNPPTPAVQGLRYALYGTGGVMGLLALWVGVEWTKFSVRPLPVGITGPVIVYPKNGDTPLRPQREGVHQELQRLSEFSDYLPKALIASEDNRYYWHLGVDPIGILRAGVVNLQGLEIRQGGSTITQQLARTLYPNYVGRQGTLTRKLQETVVALKLEAFYSKDRILRAYLNRAYLGMGMNGFEDAARFYFDKSAAELTISEAATLVAMLPAPNRYNPVQDYETAVQKRDRVINRMVEMGMISPQQAQRARRSRIELSPEAEKTLSSTTAPHFYSYVFRELRALLGSDLASEGNFIVETTLNLRTQAKAEAALRQSVNDEGKRYGFSQGAIVTLDSQTGEIVALTGGVNSSDFNRATQAQRQPGSTFKVFTYAAALAQGISPSKTYSCAPLTWKGRSYHGCERSSGNIDMSRGLAQSENVVALRMAQDVGLDNVVQMAKRLGINSKLDPVPGLVLGQEEVNLLEMTGAYATFANRGVWHRPHAIQRILDGSDCRDPENPQTCRVIYSFQEDAQASKRVISVSVAKTMTNLLQGVVQGGTGSRAEMGLGAAGKTGTTDNSVDLWFIGYALRRPIITGVWLGNDDSSSTQGSSGQAAQLWRDYMRRVVK
ncbi:MAG: penicillin-binding protein [Cyanobacteria bacterium SW_10_48_33]|nr:MAG: penicillin-binding protein [Cyanobacteria bacterium SW_10_48_33]